MSGIRSELIRKYQEILFNTDPKLIFEDLRSTPDYSGFSNLFLADAPSMWEQGKRVLIVGRETRGWKPKHPISHSGDLVKLICELMKMQSNHYNKFISVKKEPGMRFFHFLRKVAEIVGKGNVAWCNIFALDWEKSTPSKKKTPHFEAVVELSEKLLKAQISILQPDVIIFASGGAGSTVRRRYFPTSGPESVCSDPKDFDGVANSNLWAFKLYGKIQCFRTDHPSSRAKPYQEARTRVLEELKLFLGL